MNKKRNLLDLLDIYMEFGIDFVMEIKKSLCIIENRSPFDENNGTDCISNFHDDVVKSINTDRSYQLKRLNDLREEVENFKGCSLKANANHTVFSDGNFQSQVMLIGEAPGANEDLKGIPFCGASGNLLDKMLASISLDRNSVYITNTVFWRPPNNRRPTEEEIDLCRPFLEKHIAIIDPKIIVLVGSTAVCSVMHIQENISKVRGKFYSYTNNLLKKKIAMTAIFHPAYLMRQPMQKKLAWEDLKLIKNFLEVNNIIV